MVIVVNDICRSFGGGRISFSQVVLMGLYNIPAFERVNPEVTYKDPDQELWAKMFPRTSLIPKEGIKFKVFNGKKEPRSPLPVTAADVKDFLVSPEINKQEDKEPRVRVKQEAIERRKAEFAAKGLPWPPHITEEQKAAEIKRVHDLMAPHEAKYQARQAEKDEPLARLKDAYIIINLLYREAVEAGRMTPGRMMAGRLLYSIGYQEMVKTLENR